MARSVYGAGVCIVHCSIVRAVHRYIRTENRDWNKFVFWIRDPRSLSDPVTPPDPVHPDG